MSFPTPTTPVYRKTKQGDFVIFGPADQITEGPVTVHLKSGATKKTFILSVGAIFKLDCGTEVRYGYQTASSEAAIQALQGASKPSSQTAATIGLDADDFMPDEAGSSADDVPDDYVNEALDEQFA